MRIALLTTHDRDSSAGAEPAPFRRYAGSRLIERQLDLALAAGCETIICLADSISAEVIDLQHRAERADTKFIILNETYRLAEAVSEDCELLVMASGVLPAESVVLEKLSEQCILVFPAQEAVAKGYERIDLELAWSGILLVRGVIVECLADLPSDIDVPSALLRLSLQADAKPIILDGKLIEQGEWHWKPNRHELEEREKRWIRTNVRLAPPSAPGLAVTDRIAVRLARDALGKSLESWLFVAAGVTAAIALALSILGMPSVGLAFGGLMAAFASIIGTVERIGSTYQLGSQSSSRTGLADLAIDPVLVVLVALASNEDTQWLRWFVPAILFGLLRLGEMVSVPRWRPSYSDRVAMTVLLIPAAFFGWAQGGAALLAGLALLSLFVTTKSKS